MIKHEAAQGSTLWYQLRAGVPTASEFHNLLTPQFKLKTGETVKSYLASKLAEEWLGGPLPGFTAWATEQGKLREQKAIPWYELEHGATIERVGFITTDDKRAGCSPDGLLGEDGGIEIKCAEPTQHVKYLLAGKVPDDYQAQVHGSMFVTGRPWWKFLSYRPGFPPLLVTVERDDQIQARIAEAISFFHGMMARAMASIIQANGGIRAKKQPLYKEPDWVTCPVEELNSHRTDTTI